MDPSIDFTALYKEFDTAVMGRKTYAVTAAQGGHVEFPGLDFVVFSRTLAPVSERGLRIVNDDARTFVAALKKKPGRDIWLFGGGSLFQSLLDARLVDSVEVAVIPVLLGAGIPLLPPGSRTTLRLVDQKGTARERDRRAQLRGARKRGSACAESDTSKREEEEEEEEEDTRVVAEEANRTKGQAPVTNREARTEKRELQVLLPALSSPSSPASRRSTSHTGREAPWPFPWASRRGCRSPPRSRPACLPHARCGGARRRRSPASSARCWSAHW